MNKKQSRALVAVLVVCVSMMAAAWLVCRVCRWAWGGMVRAKTHVSAPLDLRLLPGFLTHEECDALRDAAVAKGMKRSTVVGSDQPNAQRTSSNVFLVESDAPVVKTVYDKVAATMQLPRGRMEDMQVACYEPGQKYEAHYDPCMRCHRDGGDLLREFTVLVYLNDEFEGGTTDFPLAQRSVKPVKGLAAAFRSMVGDKIITESKHQGTKVDSGVKWLATIWIRTADVKTATRTS